LRLGLGQLYPSQYRYSSTNHSVGKDMPEHNINIPVQNIQLARIFQYKIFGE
jgi:hypothetical protein